MVIVFWELVSEHSYSIAHKPTFMPEFKRLNLWVGFKLELETIIFAIVVIIMWGSGLKYYYHCDYDYD